MKKRQVYAMLYKKTPLRALALAFSLLAACLLSSCGSPSASEDPAKTADESAAGGSAAAESPAASSQADAQKTAFSPLNIRFLKVGKADAMILTSGNETLVLDAGEEDDGAELLSVLSELSVSRVDYLIITHFDKDHVGGADTLLENFEVGTVYLPDYEGEGTDYNEFIYAMEKAGISPIRLTASVSFPFGDAQVSIDPPASYEVPEGETEYDNNFSLITTIVHGENRMVFMGDAEKAEIRDWLLGASAEKCALLKFPHHGSYNKALSELLKTLSPAYAVICDSDKNPADDKALELLAACGVQVFETKDGDVLASSDGKTISIVQ
ncbi:MAG: MBL fold metallo-hydrolase [Lachnospiraceae bacterium]|nr:MBL fold metallo-hydrolase [Lachnospiraceae bacterium]